MDESVTRIFIKFKTRYDREVYWGMWFTKESAIDWATEEMKSLENQADDDPFVGYELMYTNVLRDKIGKTYGLQEQ